MSGELVSFTEEEIIKLKELGLEPGSWWCRISEDVHIDKRERGYDIWEPHDYYDEEHDYHKGTHLLWRLTFDEIILYVKKYLGIK